MNQVMSVIRLSESIINQIAAGEVIERPASVVKELMENSIDSGASRIDLVTAAGGKNLVRVADNGNGMSSDDLVLAVQRHCTSKLSSDLLDIKTLGFRGEALPSIGAVSELTINSRVHDAEQAWRIKVDGGVTTGPMPSAHMQGTTIDVARLFHATPARLKFLKSDRAETAAITDVFKRMALAFPGVRFSASGQDRQVLEYPATDLIGRTSQVLGSEFSENALEIDAEREGVRLFGYAGLPTYNRGNAQHQFFFVNGRPIKDKLVLGAVRGAYSDFLARDRHGVVVLFIEIDPHLVDVNVHPAKADVRFRDAGLVRGLIVGALKQAFVGAGHRASSHSTDDVMRSFQSGGLKSGGGGGAQNHDWTQSPNRPVHPNGSYSTGGMAESAATFEYNTSAGFAPSGQVADQQAPSSETVSFPLGAARAQLHKNYIVAQTQEGLVLVDQHAAHERIVYEKLKSQIAISGVAGQLLLIPEVVELPQEDIDRILAQSDELKQLGLDLEKFGTNAIVIRETPAMLGEVDAKELMQSLADEMAEWDSNDTVMNRLEYVAATMACHGSVRSGRILKTEEMNALLRQMENTPNAGQCNHGRPTYVQLQLKDIERLFGRTG